jgi:ABC-type transport system involved in multi-copper enzyme maturation permease subunit
LDEWQPGRRKGMRIGTGPVFAYEQMVAARRWHRYAARSVLVAALLTAMAVIAWNSTATLTANTASAYASLGERYFYALIGVELAIVMLAAPVAAAGAICAERARGTLDHVLVTDLSDAEIVLGKLSARLVPVFGMVACSWPVMAISSLLGGIDPFALVLAFAVIVAVGVFGCSLALALSVWARKPYEVIVAAYACWTVVLIAYPAWRGIASLGAIGNPPVSLLAANPFFLAYSPYVAPNATGSWACSSFFLVTLGGSVALSLLAVWRMRPVTLKVRSRGQRNPRLGLLARLTRVLPAPSLDRNPVLWREWHRSRPSAWKTVLVGLIIGATTVGCIAGALHAWLKGMMPGGGDAVFYVGIWSDLIQVGFGLLVVSAVAPMSLAEERRRGSLDVLLATPLSTRTIVWGKWMGTFRRVPWLAIGPGIMALALATAGPPTEVITRLVPDLSVAERLFGVGLFVATLLIHGAAIASIGLLLATVFRRQALATAIGVSLFLLVTIGWPFLVFNTTHTSGPNTPVAALSPLMVAADFVDGLAFRTFHFRSYMSSVILWDMLLAVVAIVLLEWTVRTFDRCLGRMPERGAATRPDPIENARAVRRGFVGSPFRQHGFEYDYC